MYSLAILLATGLAPWAWGLAAATLALRGALAGFSERRCLKGDLPLWAFALLPAKDLLAFGLWLVSFLGSRVNWGGRSFRVTPEGKLIPSRWFSWRTKRGRIEKRVGPSPIGGLCRRILVATIRPLSRIWRPQAAL